MLLHGPFAIRDLVLANQPQMPKGQSPYASPFWVIEVVGRYTYQLSNGQKWNCRRLKRYLPSPVEWTELAPQLLNQPQGGVGVADAEEDVAGVADAEEDVAEGAENALPGPIAIAP